MDDEDPRREEIDRAIRRLEGQFEYNGQPLGPASQFEALPVPVFLSRPRPAYEELLGPLMVKGQRLVIGAGTGEGKSTLTWWMIKALSQGERFLDWYATRPCRVLLLDAEQSTHDLDRLITETNLAGAENVYIVHIPDGLSLNSSAEERTRLEVILREGEFDVVILDPLYKLHTGDPNDEREAVALMRLFDRWRVEFGFCLVLPSHMRKPDRKAKDRDFSMHEIFGASAYLRGAETVVGLRLIADGMSRLYFFKSRSPGLPVRVSWPLRFDRHSGFSIYQTPTGKVPRTTEADDQLVITMMAQAGGLGVGIAELIAETGKSRDTIQRILKRLNCTSRPKPGSAGQKIWFLSDAEPDEFAMEINADPEEDDD